MFRSFNVGLSKTMVLIFMICLLLSFSGVAVGSSGAEHGDGAEVTKEWVSTDTFRIMNFAVLAIGLVFLLKKPAAGALASRINGIKEQLSSLEEQKKEAESRLKSYAEKISMLDQEAKEILDNYIKQGEAAKKRVLEEAEKSAAKLEEQAGLSMDYEFSQAKSKLKKDILEKALVQAEEILVQNITSDDQGRLVDEYLDKVVK